LASNILLIQKVKEDLYCIKKWQFNINDAATQLSVVETKQVSEI
jgi:hypothetical protein